MADQDKINLLHQKLDFLIKQHEGFHREISDLRRQILELENKQPISITPETPKIPEPRTVAPQIPSRERVVFGKPETIRREPKIKSPSNWEKFIGENLINKIGILVLIIGVGIGAKYAIDNELISPLTRIILGYFVGLGLLGFALKLKEKFENFSAVLLSGSMAIMYFITFLAYSLYGLMPQSLTFVLMVGFTIFTVFASLKYNQQIIAIIGLVGAYAVPFLLSDGSGKVLILFSYMTLINVGILIIAFKKYWRILNVIAFSLTWIIFASWFFASFNAKIHFQIALVFLTIFFAIFYGTFLSYKLIKNEKYEVRDIFSVLSNSFIYYGLGIAILSHNSIASNYYGLFTLLNAVIHFGVSVLIHRKKLAEKNLFYLIIGLVLTFITLAIPVQLNGEWVTLSWAFQALLLFWLGRSQKVMFYENLSYIVMFLATFSLIEDWTRYHEETILFNTQFLNALLFAAAFGGVIYFQKKFSKPDVEKGMFEGFMNHAVPAILLLVIYNAIRLEISNYWDLKNLQTQAYFPDFYNYEGLWILNFTLLYLSGMFFIIQTKIRNKFFETVALVLSGITVLFFLFRGLFMQSDLIYSYHNPDPKALFETGFLAVMIHYISLICLGILIYFVFNYFKNQLEKRRSWFEIFFAVLIVWIISAEMLIWIHAMNSWNNSKLGLSILWGSLSLLLISYGIWKNRKNLRIVAIVLFGITLVKLFLYDIAELNTIRKTIVFVSLGVLLLIISFLYNKYKHLLLDDEKN